MPNPREVCKVRANGRSYDIWETVEVHRDSGNYTITHAMLTVSELSTGGTSLSDLKLAPGDKASIDLAGTNVLNGFVYLRQGAYDANTHAVQIGICSDAQIIMKTTVDGKPGQYLKKNIQQIVSSCFGKVGVGFKIIGAPSGADKIFDRISEQIGETRFGFAERLCRLRNLYMIDDGKGGINAFRGPQGQSAPLEEGKNILRARLLLKNDESVELINGKANKANPSSGPGGSEIHAEASTNSVFPTDGHGGSTFKFIAEDASDKQDLQLRVNHQVNRDSYMTVDGCITVQGWFRPEGDLWIMHVLDEVLVKSSMLIPGGSMTFLIKEVVHRQSSPEGTTTDVMITNAAGLGKEAIAGKR